MPSAVPFAAIECDGNQLEVRDFSCIGWRAMAERRARSGCQAQGRGVDPVGATASSVESASGTLSGHRPHRGESPRRPVRTRCTMLSADRGHLAGLFAKCCVDHSAIVGSAGRSRTPLSALASACRSTPAARHSSSRSSPSRPSAVRRSAVWEVHPRSPIGCPVRPSPARLDNTLARSHKHNAGAVSDTVSGPVPGPRRARKTNDTLLCG